MRDRHTAQAAGGLPGCDSGDSMAFRIRALGQVASGQVDVADDHVKVEVVLPWLLQRFAEMAQATIRKRGQLLLTKDEGK